MKQRILTKMAVVLCTLMLFSAGITSAQAYVPPSEGDAVVQSEEVRIYYRQVISTGEYEMRIWSLTRGVWITDWIPVPDGWVVPAP